MTVRRVVAVLSILLVVAGGGLLWITRGMGLSTQRPPSRFETGAMRLARNWMVPSAVEAAVNPVPNTPEAISEGLEHWADHCASCHANDGSGQTPMGRRFYPPAPDMRATKTQSLSDGALFYAIEQGIPLTGMPAWGNGTAEGERGSWTLVRFIRHLPKLTADEQARMETLNPRSPAQNDADKRIDDFLNGR